MNINVSDSAYRVHSRKTESEQDNFLEGLDRKDPEKIAISAVDPTPDCLSTSGRVAKPPTTGSMRLGEMASHHFVASRRSSKRSQTKRLALAGQL